MKKFLPLFFVTASLFAQPAEIQKDAIAAYQAGDYKTAKSLFAVVLETEPRNTVAQNYLRMIAQKEKGGTLENSLSKILIPKVEFTDASVREAVTYVAQRVSALTEGKQTLNIVWLIPSEYDARVTISLQNIPATEALKYIATSANLKLNYDARALTIRLNQ